MNVENGNGREEGDDEKFVPRSPDYPPPPEDDTPLPQFKRRKLGGFSEEDQSKIATSASRHHEERTEGGKYRRAGIGFSATESTTSISSKISFTRATAMSEGADSMADPTSATATSSNFPKGSKFFNMLAKHGFKEGQGLGKEQTGIVNPIAASKQFGKRGLGFEESNHFKATNETYEIKEINVESAPEWIETPASTVDGKDLRVVEGPWNEYDLLEEGKVPFTFVDPEFVETLHKSMKIFDDSEAREYRVARNRANPFERASVKGAGIFQNRAAVKMANVDAVCGFRLTRPKPENVRDTGGVLYFADLCAGPGGFSEYILWRRRWHTKGFGMTLRESAGGSFDFRIDKFGERAHVESYEMHFGKDGTGDITKTANMRAFDAYVRRSTVDGKGVHTVMTDGGFHVKPEDGHLKELKHRQLVLCQLALGTAVLREHGILCCKIFDTFLPFTAGLIFLMRQCFKRVAVYNPYSSRPANSERYVMCEDRHRDDVVRPVVEHLWKVNDHMNAISQVQKAAKLERLTTNQSVLFRSSSSTSSSSPSLSATPLSSGGGRPSSPPAHDVVGVVNKSLMEEDNAFVKYMRDHNRNFARSQTQALEKIAKFMRNKSLEGEPHDLIRKQCLRAWALNIPDEFAKRRDGTDPNLHPEQRFRAMEKRHKRPNREIPKYRETARKVPRVSHRDLKGHRPYMQTVADWVCLPLIVEGRSFVMGMGPNKKCAVLRLLEDKDVPAETDWYDISFCLPAGTLLEVSISNNVRLVSPTRSESSSDGTPSRMTAAIVLDAAALGHMDIHNEPYETRLALASVFAHTISKTSTDRNARSATYPLPLLPLLVERAVPLAKFSSLLNRWQRSQISMATSETAFVTKPKEVPFACARLRSYEWDANGFLMVPKPAGSFEKCLLAKRLHRVTIPSAPLRGAYDKRGVATSKEISEFVAEFARGRR